MKQDVPYLEQCALPRVLEAVGEKWSLLILRGAFNGLRHFEEFQSALGIARNILSVRLIRLVSHGILSRQSMTDDRRKVQYHLTAKGAALLPALIALRQWGEKWEDCVPSVPVLVDRHTQQPICQISIRATDGRELTLVDLRWSFDNQRSTLESPGALPLAMLSAGAITDQPRSRPI